MMKICIFFAAMLLTGCTSIRSGYVAVSGGGRVYYEACGKGEPLVLLHGHSLDRRMWNEQWSALSKHYRVVRLDFRGYGLSSPQREDLPMTHVDDVVTLMDSLRLSSAHVVGLSMGAFVAGDMLAMYPERLLSCTLASGGIRNSKGPGEPMDSTERARRDEQIAAVRAKGVRRMKSEWLEQLMSSGGSQRERMRKPLSRMIDDWSAWQALHKEVRLFYGKESWRRLEERGEVLVPTLFLRGENELKGKPFQPREARYLRHYRVVVVSDCGHMLNMERPEEFNRSILEFLNSRQAR